MHPDFLQKDLLEAVVLGNATVELKEMEKTNLEVRAGLDG
jgi:hypothetical protein